MTYATARKGLETRQLGPERQEDGEGRRRCGTPLEGDPSSGGCAATFSPKGRRGGGFGAGEPDPLSAIDLRRRDARAFAESLVARAEHLAPADRSLVQAVYREGSSAADVAALMGVHARVVRRRLRILIARMLSPTFVFVAGSMGEMARTRRQVAREVVLEGRTMREAAERIGVSLHTVRRHVDALRVMAEAARS